LFGAASSVGLARMYQNALVALNDPEKS